METIELKGVMPAAFAADPLSVRHSDVWLHDAAFHKGAFYLVEAVSGAGKTSLCSYLYGMRSDYLGDVLFDGCNIRSLSRAAWGDVRRRSLSVLFPDRRACDELTVVEHSALQDDVTHFRSSERDGELIEEAGLAEKRTTTVGRLSFGQQQRVAFVRALCQPSDFMLLDEPVSHLDAANGRILARLLTDEARRQGAGVLVTSVGSRLEMSYDHLLHL